MGLETEYATMVADRQDLDREDLPAAWLVYQQICEAIKRDQPTAPGLFDRQQLFLASGGAVSFESHPSLQSSPGGLVEIATPEVRSPGELLACQRSMDQLASEATADSETSFDLRILKNSSDALGHVYGCHENYDAEVASGFMLGIYRCFILALWLIQTITLVVSFPLMMFVVGAMGLNRYLQARKERKGATEDPADDAAANEVRGDDAYDEFDDWDAESEPEDFYASMPHWLSAIVVFLLRLVHLPTVIVLTFVAKHIAFRKQRRFLAAMLISRVALCGTGNWDSDGRFQISAKAMAVDSLSHLGGFRGERPIFVFGHWLSQLSAKSFISLWSTRKLLARRQRFQIALSDSNMSDLAEYVKVGSVSLLLDMIEAKQTRDLPRVRNPVPLLHRLASDWNLVSRIPTSRGKLSALEIQKEYLSAAKAFVESVPANLRGEASLVLYRWQELYEAAANFRKDANDTGLAMGRIDWLTKLQLLESLDLQNKPVPSGVSPDPKTSSDAWASKKKIDLRYHELSDEGYHALLMESRPELRLVDEEQIARRRKSPPAGSPAARRGWLIREFAGDPGTMQCEWSYAIIGHGKTKRSVEFTAEP
jgi:proteasome accessory factor A